MRRTPLAELDRARGARMMEYHGWEIAEEYTSLEREYESLQEGVGLIDLCYRGKLRLAGDDRRKWLHGLVTQDVTGLPDGRWTSAAALNPQGQMLTELRIFALPDALLVDLPPATAGTIPEYLDGYLFLEKVEIQDLGDHLSLLSLQGPQAPLAVSACFGGEWAELPFGGVGLVEWQGTQVIVARVHHCGTDGFDLFVDATHATALHAALYVHRREFAVDSVGWRAFNHRRVEAGVPWWGHELDSSVVPFDETLRAFVNLNKGCYIGQEIIARLDARGQVNNVLAGLLLEGSDLPERGREIVDGGRRVGRITSALRSPRLGRGIALCFLRREVNCCGSRLQIRHPEGAEQQGEVTTLPFVPDDV